jgi:hypothetical protein
MKRNVFGSAAAACLSTIVAGQNVVAQELLLNPSMDLTVPYAPIPANPAVVAPQPASWTVVGTRTISGAFTDVLASEPWAGPAPTPVTTDGTGDAYTIGTGCGGLDCGGFFRPFAGNLATGDLATGHLRQSVLGAAGQDYQFSVWAGAESNYSGLIPGTQTRTEIAIDFLGPAFTLISSSVLDLQAAGLGAPNGQAFNYARFSVAGTAPAGTLFVRPRISMLDAYANPAGGGQAFVVDDASLIAVPEPSSLLMAGLSLLGCLGTRRRTER